MTGRFITFEGGEGTGKSTQIKFLGQNLRRIGISVMETREPGGSAGAEAVRQVILSGAAKHLGPFTETLLFCAARIDHIEQRIKPALESDQWVLCDRFSDSTRAYQGVMGQVEPSVIQALERVTLHGLYPSLTIVLDLPAEIGLERAGLRRGASSAADRFEAEDLDFHRALRRAFLDIANSEPQRCIVVNGDGDSQAIADEIWSSVRARFGLTENGGR